MPDRTNRQGPSCPVIPIQRNSIPAHVKQIPATANSFGHVLCVINFLLVGSVICTHCSLIQLVCSDLKTHRRKSRKRQKTGERRATDGPRVSGRDSQESRFWCGKMLEISRTRPTNSEWEAEMFFWVIKRFSKLFGNSPERTKWQWKRSNRSLRQVYWAPIRVGCLTHCL